MKLGFAVLFTDISRKIVLPEESSIQTVKMTEVKIVLKEIHKRKDNRWVMYTLRAVCTL